MARDRFGKQSAGSDKLPNQEQIGTKMAAFPGTPLHDAANSRKGTTWLSDKKDMLSGIESNERFYL